MAFLEIAVACVIIFLIFYGIFYISAKTRAKKAPPNIKMLAFALYYAEENGLMNYYNKYKSSLETDINKCYILSTGISHTTDFNFEKHATTIILYYLQGIPEIVEHLKEEISAVFEESGKELVSNVTKYNIIKLMENKEVRSGETVFEYTRRLVFELVAEKCPNVNEDISIDEMNRYLKDIQLSDNGDGTVNIYKTDELNEEE